MRLYTVPRPPGTLPLGALLMLPLFALPFGAWILEHGYMDPGMCGLKAAIGLPCLTCGATRATMALIGGDLLRAVTTQPMIIGIYLLLVVWGLASFFTFMRNRKLVMHLNRVEDLIFKISLVALPVANWAYLIWRGI